MEWGKFVIWGHWKLLVCVHQFFHSLNGMRWAGGGRKLKIIFLSLLFPLRCSEASILHYSLLFVWSDRIATLTNLLWLCTPLNSGVELAQSENKAERLRPSHVTNTTDSYGSVKWYKTWPLERLESTLLFDVQDEEEALCWVHFRFVWTEATKETTSSWLWLSLALLIQFLDK